MAENYNEWIKTLSPENRKIVELAYKNLYKPSFFTEAELKELHMIRWKEELKQRSLPKRTLPPSDGLGLKGIKIEHSDVMNVFEHANDLGITNVVAELQKIRSRK